MTDKPPYDEGHGIVSRRDELLARASELSAETATKTPLMSRRRMMQVGAGMLALGATGKLAVEGGKAYIRSEGFQRANTFFPETDLAKNPLPTMWDPGQYNLQDVYAQTIGTKSGDTLTAWRSEPFEKNKKTLVLFPGNGGHLGASPDLALDKKSKLGEGRDAYVKIIRDAMKKGYQVLAVNHVGYAGSNHREPSEKKIYAGAEAAMDWLAEQGIGADDMRILGVSMGAPVAAHAANYVAQKGDFKDIRLTLVNGVISFQEAIEQNAPEFVAKEMNSKPADRMNTGVELEAMGTLPNSKNIHVTYLRGKDDPATPPDQLQQHEAKKAGLDFEAKEVPGRHYPASEVIFEALERVGPSKEASVLSRFVNRTIGRAV